jgi:chromosome segregation ATPase
MQANQFDFSVLDVEVEGQTLDKANIGCYISADGQDVDCIIVDDTDHRLVLDLGNAKSVLRVTVKGLVDAQKLGSVSFLASTFHEHAKKSTKDLWITLFDMEDDDLYDGNLTEDDPEMPRIKISFTRGSTPTSRKKGATKSKTLKVTTATTSSVQQTGIAVSQQDLATYSVQALTTELQTKLEELMDNLRNEHDDLHAENNERVATLANLELVHAELKGEHEQDLAFSKALEELKRELTENLTACRGEIEQNKNNLLSIIKDLEAATQASQSEKDAAQKKKDELTAVVEAIEDLKENGFTPEAKRLRGENEANRTKTDKLSQDLLSERDDRNKHIQAHRELVEKFEETVQNYHDDLRKVAGSKKEFAYERDNLLKESDFVALEGDFFQRRIELGQFDISSLKDALDRLTKEYAESDQEFNRYTDQLRTGLKNQDFVINDLLKKFAARENQISDLQNESDRQKNQIEHYNSELTKIEQIGYEEKFTQLSGDLKKAEDARRAHQDELEKAHEGLTIKLNTFADDLEGRRRERDEQAQKIDEALKNLQNAQNTINELQKELETLGNKMMTDDNRDKVASNLAAEREAVEQKLQGAVQERDKIQSELQEAVNTLNEKHARVEEQKRAIEQLRKDISELKTLIEEKKKIIKQLEIDIQLAEEEIERLKGIVDDLHRKIADRDDEIERLRKLIDEHNARIAQLEAEIGQEPAPEISYKAKKGDLVDEMLAQYIQNCPVPVKRLGDGFYLFGTKKIYAKIMNGKLVIRVGGGYMFIEKFIETYADAELNKINSILEKEGLTHVDQIDLEEYCLKRNRTGYGNTPGEQSPSGKSPKGASFRKTFNGSGKMNGSMRSPKNVKASQVVKQN